MKLVKRNQKLHNHDSPLLIGELKENDVVKEVNEPSYIETMTLPEEEYTLEDAVNEEQNSFSSDEYQASKDYLLGKFSQSNFISLGNENLDNFGEMIWAHSYIDMEECDEWCRKHSVKPIMLFQAAFSHVISLITRNDDFAYWTVYHNRFDPKLWRCYGMHAKSIPIKNVNSKNITVIDYLRKSYDEMKSAIIHSNYPFTHFCKELGVAPSLFFNFVAKKDVNYYNSEKFSEQTILQFKNEFINSLEEIIYANKEILYEDDIFFFSNHPDKKNLVFIHPASYGSEFFHYMAERIKDDYSFSVIEHYNLNHQESQLTSIEELAEKYIDILKSIQPEGPYYLGGVCFGGAVAHEMAIQLEKNGEIVEKLIIMDAHNIEDKDLKKLIIQDQALHAREYMDEGMINEKVNMEDMVYNARLTSKLWLDYKPGYYGGDVLYFKATKRPEEQTPAADKLYDYVLSRKCGGYEGVLDDEKLFIVEIPVEHNDIISQEALEYIVPSLREFIYDGDL